MRARLHAPGQERQARHRGPGRPRLRRQQPLRRGRRHRRRAPRRRRRPGRGGHRLPRRGRARGRSSSPAIPARRAGVAKTRGRLHHRRRQGGRGPPRRRLVARGERPLVGLPPRPAGPRRPARRHLRARRRRGRDREERRRHRALVRVRLAPAAQHRGRAVAPRRPAQGQGPPRRAQVQPASPTSPATR